MTIHHHGSSVLLRSTADPGFPEGFAEKGKNLDREDGMLKNGRVCRS